MGNFDTSTDGNRAMSRHSLTLLPIQLKMRLLGTPSFNDTPMGGTEATASICAWTSLNYREGRLLSGIIYYRTTKFLMGGSSPKNLWLGNF